MGAARRPAGVRPHRHRARSARHGPLLPPGPWLRQEGPGGARRYLDRFWNEFSADPKRFDEASRRHYARLYALPGAMHSGFEQFKAFDQDAIDNKAFLAKGMLAMPVLAVGGEASFGPMTAVVMRAPARHVQEGVLPPPGHWLIEENPTATGSTIVGFRHWT